ncbi:MAG: hypothetical protein RLZZ283_21 [Candidatus Parcubacteria bacterium]|jgi:hypothetical protein
MTRTNYEKLFDDDDYASSPAYYRWKKEDGLRGTFRWRKAVRELIQMKTGELKRVPVDWYRKK